MVDWCSAHAVTVDEVYALEELFKNLSSSLHQVSVLAELRHPCLLLRVLAGQMCLHLLLNQARLLCPLCSNTGAGVCSSACGLRSSLPASS